MMNILDAVLKLSLFSTFRKHSGPHTVKVMLQGINIMQCCRYDGLSWCLALLAVLC